jgi:hypothetical protein
MAKTLIRFQHVVAEVARTQDGDLDLRRLRAPFSLMPVGAIGRT